MPEASVTYFKRELDMGSHQVAHRVHQMHPECTSIHEIISTSGVLDEYTYVIIAQTDLIQAAILNGTPGCRASVLRAEEGLWAVYFTDKEHASETDWECGAIVASSAERPHTLGILGLLPVQHVVAARDWKDLFNIKVSGTAQTPPPADQAPIVELQATIPQHRYAAMRVFLLGRNCIATAWVEAINAWVDREGTPAVRYPTMSEFKRSSRKDPQIGQWLEASAGDDTCPWSCRPCRAEKSNAEDCAHLYSAMMEELVGHHLDVAQPVSFETWSSEQPLVEHVVPEGLLVSPHTFSESTIPGIPRIRPSLEDISGWNELKFHRRIERWGRLAGLVAVESPQEMRALDFDALTGSASQPVPVRQATMRIQRKWDGLYQVSTQEIDLKAKDIRTVPIEDILADLNANDASRAEICNTFTDIMRSLDKEDFSCDYAANIDTERIEVYPKEPTRPFYQYDLVGDWQSRYPDRNGLNHPFHYAGSYGSIFALHSEDADMYSINEHLDGAAKVWIAVPQRSTGELLKLINRVTGSDACDQATRHKDLFIDPRIVHEEGIPIHAVIQRPGDIIFTFPAAHHQGFNAGVNLNIAVNYIRLPWIPDAIARKKCTCKRGRESPEGVMQSICGFETGEATWTAVPRDDRLVWQRRDVEHAALERINRRIEAAVHYHPSKRSTLSKWGQFKEV